MYFKYLHILFILFLSVATLYGTGNVRTTFKNKKIELEFPIENARNNNNSSIDLYCKFCDVPNLKIEYKSGPTSIDSKKIKEQFIQRDLYNADNLNEIQWRMEGTELTKEKLVAYLEQNRGFIEDLGFEKIKSFYPNDEFINVNNFVDKFINKFNDNTNYNLIFR